MIKQNPKPRTTNSKPTIMAFAFDKLGKQSYEITRVEWSMVAKELLKVIQGSLRENWDLPTRDLRLRLQIRDKAVIRVDWELGCWSSPFLLFTESEVEKAKQAANDALAEWLADAVIPLEKVDQAIARQLRQLALKGEAAIARKHCIPVFDWDVNNLNNSAKLPQNGKTLFTDLADFVASKLTGQEVYPMAGPMRREVSSDISKNEARLITDPIQLALPNGKMGFFSLGLTISVETFPGRALPVIKIKHRKSVWARQPKAKYESLSGFALPSDESRALQFEINSDLSLTAQYKAIARQYDLPLLSFNNESITAADLGLQGYETDRFSKCKIVITHRHGQAESGVVGRGVTDLDKQLSFELIEQILKPYGFFSWDTLIEIPTHYKQQQDADSGWKFAPDTQADAENEEVDERYIEWARRMHRNLESHYGGTYHFILAYGNGLQKQAIKAKNTLIEILGQDKLIVHLEALPDGVHGSKRELSGQSLKPVERAQERVKSWQPFIETVKGYMDENHNFPVKGILVMANNWYDKYPDDNINKRVARITLNRELGLIIQYLLPIETKRDGSISERHMKDFKMRVVNAWRDMAWKSLGQMQSVELKFERSFGRQISSAAPVILGIGVIRTNRKRRLRNDASFIPYAIELNPSTATCQASMLLQSGNKEAKATPMLNLNEAIRLLTANGPSHLSNKEDDRSIREERNRLTQKFIYDILLERSKVAQSLIILVDTSTLGGIWPWLADTEVNPDNIKLNNESHIEQDFPNITFLRIRYHIAPKVIMETPQVRVRIGDTIRPAARWSDADLYRLSDTSEKMPTYLSFGTKIFKPVRGTSSYRSIPKVDYKAGEENLVEPWTEDWSTPNAIEITVLQHAKGSHLQADQLAQLVESLRSEYGHFGSWTKAPAPLHFSTLLKEYVPDYELDEEMNASEEFED